MTKTFWLAVLAYLLPTFPLAYLWHLSFFADRYHQLAIYRDDVVIPMGLASMMIQALLLAWAYPRLIGNQSWARGATRFGLFFGLLAWSYSVLPGAAKYRMSSISDFFWLETAFTAVQYVVVAPLIALAYGGLQSRAPSAELKR
jgi:hypothetical protein